MKQPKIRPDARNSLTNLIISAMEREHNYLYQCCLNCEAFKEKTEICLYANARPPARIITFGCELWLDRDSIPF